MLVSWAQRWGRPLSQWVTTTSPGCCSLADISPPQPYCCWILRQGWIDPLLPHSAGCQRHKCSWKMLAPIEEWSQITIGSLISCSMLLLFKVPSPTWVCGRCVFNKLITALFFYRLFFLSMITKKWEEGKEKKWEGKKQNFRDKFERKKKELGILRLATKSMEYYLLP